MMAEFLLSITKFIQHVPVVGSLNLMLASHYTVCWQCMHGMCSSCDCHEILSWGSHV